MEENYVIKTTLESRREELVNLINGRRLLDSEYGRKIFAEPKRVELKERFKNGDDEVSATSALLDALRETGAEGYDIFINGLVVTGHFEPVRLLEPGMNVVSKYKALSAVTPRQQGLRESRSAPSRLSDRSGQDPIVTADGDDGESLDGGSSNPWAPATGGDDIAVEITPVIVCVDVDESEAEISEDEGSLSGLAPETDDEMGDTSGDLLSNEMLDDNSGSKDAAANLDVDAVAKTERFYNGCPKNDEIYKMDENPRGCVLIIENDKFKEEDDHKPRTGSDRDSSRLKSIFEQLYFHVEHHRNLGFSDMENALEWFCRDLDHMDACFVFVLSHGVQTDENYSTKDAIISWEGEQFPTESILRHFSNQKAPKLKGKPKVLAFQACRGDMVDEGIHGAVQHDAAVGSASLKSRSQADNKLDTRNSPKSHFCSDMIVLHSTGPGFASVRDATHGSWFIQELCDVIRDRAHDLHFKKIADETVRRVMRRIGLNKTWIQAPEYTVKGGFEKLYFNPGLSSVDNVRVDRPISSQESCTGGEETSSEKKETP